MSNPVCFLLSLLLLTSFSSAARVFNRKTTVTVDDTVSLPDGAVCHLPLDLKYGPPFCIGGPSSCLLNHLPAKPGKPLRGRCTSAYASGNFCTVGEFNFAVGVKNIPPYGPSVCETCSCIRDDTLPGTNKATCQCDPLPPCYVDPQGLVLGAGCSAHAIESQCVIVTPGKGPLVNGVQASLGRCQAPQVISCVSAGPDWGPLFYAEGAAGVPQPGNRCYGCTCGKEGKISGCVEIAGCTAP